MVPEESDPEVDISALAKFSFRYMRRFALGVLRLKPKEFGTMMVGDFLDAVRGYNAEKYDEYKVQAALTRTAVTLLVNIQLRREDRVRAEDMWRFPWENEEGNDKPAEITPEEIEEHLRKAQDFFKNKT